MRSAMKFPITTKISGWSTKYLTETRNLMQVMQGLDFTTTEAPWHHHLIHQYLPIIKIFMQILQSRGIVVMV